MGVVVVVGTGSAGSVAGSDFVVCTAVEVRIEVDTGFGIDWVGTSQDDTMLVLVHPERALHFPFIRCRQYFLSRDGMLYNIFLHVLLTYKIYKRGFLGYLLPFANIKTPCRDVL